MKTNTRIIGRDAKTGQWIPIVLARRRKSSAMVHRFKTAARKK
jgi:hypothetical protein